MFMPYLYDVKIEKTDQKGLGRLDFSRTARSHKLFLKMGQPRPLLSFIFGLFKQTSLQILQQINVKTCPSSIRCQESNP